jgi:hypothetical protein
MPHTFELKIDLGNEEFDTPDNGIPGVARLLREAADKVEAGRVGRAPLYDINGNRVGYFDFDADDASDGADDEDEVEFGIGGSGGADEDGPGSPL